MLPTALNYIRADAQSTLSLAERSALTETLATLNKPAVAVTSTNAPRQFVKEWMMTELEPALNQVAARRDLARGKLLFNEAGCAQCHRLGSEGGFIGPDLTAVSARFDRRALLESIIEPSKVVAEVYRPVMVTLTSGAIYDGRIVSEDAKSISLAINPVDPDQRRRIAKSDIASQRVSELSPMPEGLVNTLNREEILDLLAWLETGGTSSALLEGKKP
jgi:putative heme-binding domain-containing protein